MLYDSYHQQRRIKQLNRERIIMQLKGGPKRFKDLLTITGLSPMGLSKALNEMVSKDKSIQKIIHEGKPAYTLTRKGEDTFKAIWFLLTTLTEMRDRGARYEYGYIPLQAEDEQELYFWPTAAHMAVDKTIDSRKLNPIIPHRDLPDIQDYIFERIIQNAKGRKVKVDESIQGKVVVGIEIDYSDFVKALKTDSLEKWRSGR